MHSEQLKNTTKIPKQHVEVQKLCPDKKAVEHVRRGQHPQENNDGDERGCPRGDKHNDKVDQIPPGKYFVGVEVGSVDVVQFLFEAGLVFVVLPAFE